MIFSNFSASISCQSMESHATIPSSLSRSSCQEGISLMLLPLCQHVLSDTLPRQQKSWGRTSPSAPDSSSYKHSGFHRRHCLKTILIWMGQYSKPILARVSSISASSRQAQEVPSAISEASSLPVLPDYLPQWLLVIIIISTQCSPPQV